MRLLLFGAEMTDTKKNKAISDRVIYHFRLCADVYEDPSEPALSGKTI